MDAWGAALRGDMSTLREALDKDDTLIDRGQAGGLFDSRTLLMCAASKGHLDLVRELLRRGARRDIKDKRGQSAAALAQKQGHDSVSSLIEAHSPTCAWTESGSADQQKQGVGVSAASSQSKRARDAAQPSLTESATCSSERSGPSEKRGCEESAGSSQSKRARDSARPSLATQPGLHLKSATQVVSERPGSSSKRGREESTAAEPVQKRAHIDTVSRLVQLALNNSMDELLACVDADPSLLDRAQEGGMFDSRTLLMCAASRGHEQLVRRLLGRGADASRVDKRGSTALALARRQGHGQVADTIESWRHGAEVAATPGEAELLTHGNVCEEAMTSIGGGSRVDAETITLAACAHDTVVHEDEVVAVEAQQEQVNLDCGADASVGAAEEESNIVDAILNGEASDDDILFSDEALLEGVQ